MRIAFIGSREFKNLELVKQEIQKLDKGNDIVVWREIKEMDYRSKLMHAKCVIVLQKKDRILIGLNKTKPQVTESGELDLSLYPLGIVLLEKEWKQWKKATKTKKE